MVTRRVTSRVTAPTARRVTGDGVSGVSNPLAIFDTDLQAWFSSTDSSRLTTVGGLVSNWAASGEAGTEAIQGTISYRPSLNFAGSRIALIFGETAVTDDWLDCNNNSTPLVPESGDWMAGFAGVIKELPSTGSITLFSQYLDNTSLRFTLSIFNTGASQVFLRDGATSRVARSTTTVSNGQAFYATFFRSGSTWGARLNGGGQAVFTSSANVLQVGNLIGAITQSSTTNYNGVPVTAIFSGSLYDVVVSSGYDVDQMSKLETYLSSRT